MYFVKRAITIGISSTFIIASAYPSYAWFGIGDAVGSLAQKAGFSKKISGYIAAGVDSYTGDPRGTAKLLVKSFSDAGLVGDADSCAAFSDLASTGAGAVAAYYSGGTAAGLAKGIGSQTMNQACAEQYGSAGSGKEAARQAYTNNAGSVNAEILKAQIDAGVRIVELQTQSKVEEAKILAKSALDVENTKQNGETTRAILQSKTLIKMTEMNNLKDLELARLDLEKTRDTNATHLAETKDTNATNLAITKVTANAGTVGTGINAAKDVLVAVLNRPRQPKETVLEKPTQPIAAASTDPVNNLFREWGWQKVSCAPGLVFIKGLSAETVCTNPTNTIPAGEYFYNSSNSQLEPVAVSSSAPQINHSSIPEEENTVSEEMNETTQEEEE
jgi:hypothetical protein